MATFVLTAEAAARAMGKPRPSYWAYGVTAVPERRKDLLPRTLGSLALAGFDKPVLFVDGCGHADALSMEREFGLEVVNRGRRIRVFGNWTLALAELFAREPQASKYALFQDDMVTCRGLKQYLDRCKYPERGYWNMYTFPENFKLARGEGWYRSNQRGKGAVALAFDREAVITLLTHSHMVMRPLDQQWGWRKVDGGIVTALRKAGWAEFVHNPSLVQHTGKVSTMKHSNPEADSFRGEDFDAASL